MKQPTNGVLDRNELAQRLWTVLFSLPFFGLSAGLGVGIFILAVKVALKWSSW